MLESRFKTKLISEIKQMFPGCIVTHGNANEIQGFPDIVVLYGNTWFALEGKKSANEKRQPNQPYYVDLMNEMSFARFIYPENKEEVLDELQQAFQPRRPARLSRRQ
jgi:phosphoribosyl 1,2-cyclic phosphodiesterase